MLTGEFDLPRAGCLRIGAIDLIPEGTGIIPPQIVYLVVGFVEHFPHLYVEGSPPLPKGRTPASGVRAHLLELWKVESCDWIKKDYILKEVPCPVIPDAANIVYPYESLDVLRDDSLCTVPIQQQTSIDNRCRHLCPRLSQSFSAVLWWHHCELKMNLHPKR